MCYYLYFSYKILFFSIPISFYSLTSCVLPNLIPFCLQPVNAKYLLLQFYPYINDFSFLYLDPRGMEVHYK